MSAIVTKLKLAVAATAIAASAVSPVAAADLSPEPPIVDEGPRGGVVLGMLDCQVDGGYGLLIASAKEMTCQFRQSNGRVDAYTGYIKKFGVDVGFTTGARLLWYVVAPTAGYQRGALGGSYGGVTAEATVWGGVGANVLIGSSGRSIALQPASVTGQVGLNLAATVTHMALQPAT